MPLGFTDLVSTGLPCKPTETPLRGREEEEGTRLQMKGRGEQGGKTRTCAKTLSDATMARGTTCCSPLETSQPPRPFPTPALVQGSAPS